MRNGPAANRPRVLLFGPEAARLLRAALLDVGWTVVAVLAAAGLVHALGLRAWPFELVHHFVPAYALVATALLLFALLLRDLRLTAVACSLFAFFVLALAVPLHSMAPQPMPVIEASNAPVLSAGTLPLVLSIPPVAGESPTKPAVTPAPSGSFSIITNNVYCANWNRNGLLRWLHSRPADVVVLQEVPPAIDRALPSLGEAYPFSSRISSSGARVRGVVEACQGIVVLSTFPIASATAFQPIKAAWPALLASLQMDDATRVSLAVVHAADPIRAIGLQARDEFLQLLATHLDAIHDPLIVLGDFNASPFTPALREFEARTALQLSPWNPATYPARMGTFGISIDHVLVRNARLLRLDPLPAVGSDHRPLRALISLPVAATDIPPSRRWRQSPANAFAPGTAVKRTAG